MSSGQFGVNGGLSFLRAFRTSLAAWLRGTSVPLDGELLTSNAFMVLDTRFSFKLATMSSLSFPTLDAASKDAGRLAVTFRTSSIASQPASGKGGVLPDRTALWRCAAFRVQIDGIDMSKTTRVDRVTFTAPGGGATVSVTVAGDNNGLRAWHEQAVISGKSEQLLSKAMKVTCLAPDLSTSLYDLAFQVLPVRLTATGTANASTVAGLTVTLAASKASLVVV
jgi:hypothetical protein